MGILEDLEALLSGDTVEEGLSKIVTDQVYQNPTLIPQEKAASINKFTDDGSLDFTGSILPPELMSPEQQIEYNTRKNTKPIHLYTDDELIVAASNDIHPNYENAKNELALRNRWKKQSQAENFKDWDYVKRNADRLAKLTATGIAKIPGDVETVAGMVSAVPGVLGSDVGKETSQKLLKSGAEIYEEVNKQFAINDPQNPIESAAQIAGGAGLHLLKGATLPSSMGVRAIESITPVTIGGGAKNVAANIGVQFVADQAIRTAIQGDADKYQTIFENIDGEAYAEAKDDALDYKVGKNSANADIRNSDFARFAGWMGLGTIGMIVAPRSIKYLSEFVPTVQPKAVDPSAMQAPSDLESNVPWWDVVSAHVSDPTLPLYRSMDRVGLSRDKLSYTIDSHTSAQHQAKVASAIETGELNGLDYKYKSKVAISNVLNRYSGEAPENQALLNEYARLNALEQAMKHGFKKPVTTLDGETATSIRKGLKSIEAQFPDAKLYQAGIKQINEGLLNFAADGEYAIVKRADANFARQNHSSFVSMVPDTSHFPNILSGEISHVFKYSESFKNRPGPHLPAYDNMQNWATYVMRSRILNSVRGTVIDMFLSNDVGKKLFREISESEYQANPTWHRKTVTMFRKGKRERYVTNQPFADALHFDPNWAQHSWLLTPGKVFQWNTTGHGAFGFAWTRFLRDTHLAQITTPKEYRHLGLYLGGRYIPMPGAAQTHAFAKIFEQLWNQGREGFVAAVQRDSSPAIKWMKSTFGDTFVKNWANDVHHAYKTSGYYAVKQAGGVDTSYSKQQVQAAKTKIDKMFDKIPNEGKVLARIWGNVIDSIQNAGVYGVTSRNVKRTLRKSSTKPGDIDRVVADLKGITGDVTKTGRPLFRDRYSNKTRAFGVSPELQHGVGKSGIVGENVITKGILKTTGRLSHAALTSTPWYNAMVQSFRAIGKAYWNDPLTFTTRMWVGVGVPQMASYLYTASLGQEYLDYMMEGRTEYDKATKWYLPWPGRPPEEGIQIPFPLEIAPLAYGFMQSMDYALRGGGSELSTIAKTSFNTFFGLVFPPSLAAATPWVFPGMQAPSNIVGIGQEGYKPIPNPYSQLHKLGKFGDNLEISLRALFGANHATYMGFVNSLLEEGDVKAAVKEAAFQQKQRIPVLSEGKRSTMFTELGMQNVEKAAKIREWESLYRIWRYPNLMTSKTPKDITGFGKLDVPQGNPPGMVVPGTLDLEHRPFTEPGNPVKAAVVGLTDGTFAVYPTMRDNMRSLLKKSGDFSGSKDTLKYLKNNNYGIFSDKASAEAYLAQLTSAEFTPVSEGEEGMDPTRPGLPPKRPIQNWMVAAGLQTMHNHFKTNNMQFKTMTDNLNLTTKAVQSLKWLDEGKIGKWKESLTELPDGATKRLLLAVNPKSSSDIIKVTNHFEKKRLMYLKQMEMSEESANNSLNKLLSSLAKKEIKVNLFDLDPYSEAPIPPPPGLLEELLKPEEEASPPPE